MIGTVVTAYVHLLTGIVLFGYGLFWTILARSVARVSTSEECLRLLRVTRDARWPAPAVPERLRPPLHAFGWLLILVGGASGVLGYGFESADTSELRFSLTSLPGWKVLLFATLLISHTRLVVRPTPGRAYLTFALIIVLVALSIPLTRQSNPPSLYVLAALVHVLAASLWLGHMFFWSLVGGPALKRVTPPETAATLREHSLSGGGFGWPCLAVLIITGSIMLGRKIFQEGVFQGLRAPEPSVAAIDVAFLVKLLLVGCMVIYQTLVGHRPAPRLIYVNILVAFLVLGISVMVVRLWS